jgi:hypothetical protein
VTIAPPLTLRDSILQVISHALHVQLQLIDFDTHVLQPANGFGVILARCGLPDKAGAAVHCRTLADQTLQEVSELLMNRDTLPV